MAPENLLSRPEPRELDTFSLNGDIVEFSMLMPGWQAAALEATARSQGLTVGQLVRRLVQDFFSKFAQPRPA
jgi:hypothetical protein